MTHHLYALLVGINQYDPRSGVSTLRGCTNDARAMKAYLEARVASRAQLHVQMLLDEQATRQAIIDGFRQHLQRARAGDTVLFYYAGHGSQEIAPKEFWAIDPDRLNETLVCYDSRVDNTWDLADKELARLIADVSQQNPHIAVVLDCCHSGSGTRGGGDLEFTPGFAKRRAPMNERDRPADSFIVSLEELEIEKTETMRTRSLNETTAGWRMPQGRHVLIAACRDTEEASEYHANSRHCGAFSYFLLETLQKANGSLTYRDLFKATYARICAQISAQSPQLEAPYLEDLDRPFLGGAIASFPPYFTLSYSQGKGWAIDGGAVHGIQSPVAGETTQLALFPFDATPGDMEKWGGAIAQAFVTNVRPQLSYVQTEGALDCEATYKAVITDVPVPPLKIALAGDPNKVDLIRQALQNKETAAAPSLYLQEVEEAELAKFCVLASDSGYRVVRRFDSAPPVADIPAQAPDAVDKTLQTLAHIARWMSLAELSQPAASQLPTDAVEMQLYYNDQPVESGQLRLSYEQRGQQQRSPYFKVKLINHTAHRLYCSLLDLTEDYSISAPFFSSGGVWLEGNSEIWASVFVGGQLTDQIPTSVPQPLWEQGVTEYQDILKLVASTAEFDPTLLSQSKLSAAGVSRARAVTSQPRSTLGRLMKRVTTRDIGGAAAVETVDDWMTHQVVLTTVRPQAKARISAGRTVALTGAASAQSDIQISIRPHSHLQAAARLTTLTEATRDADVPNLPPFLREQTQPLIFTRRRGTAPGLSTLELSEVEQAESVTPENPLTLIVNTPLAAGESVLPIAYDGEFFLPLGYGRTKGGQTEIVLQRLPLETNSAEDETSAINTRSIGGALQIFFRKVATETLGETLSQKLGLSFEYPLLAAVDLDSAEEATYFTNADDIKARVAQSEKIVIYVHGIIGDTRSMVPSVRAAHVNIAGQSRAMSKVYDLVLAYDYESLNTSIAMSAVQLKRRLAAVGIVPGHGKTVHIVAHSMGGLVSRWLVEKEGGDELIQHLIMLGTPNAGSPWPVVQAGIVKAATFAINGLSSVVWPLRLLGSVMNAIEAIDVALDEMEPGSELLTLLAAGEPPIPYSIVAGNTDLILVDEKAALRARLERKLSKLAAFPFLKASNDIAVSVSSIRQVPTGRNHAPQVREVACNHMVYFIDPVGLAGLSWAIERAFSDDTSKLTLTPSGIPAEIGPALG